MGDANTAAGWVSMDGVGCSKGRQTASTARGLTLVLIRSDFNANRIYSTLMMQATAATTDRESDAWKTCIQQQVGSAESDQNKQWQPASYIRWHPSSVFEVVSFPQSTPCTFTARLSNTRPREIRSLAQVG